jgi:hypothetical protein
MLAEAMEANEPYDFIIPQKTDPAPGLAAKDYRYWRITLTDGATRPESILSDSPPLNARDESSHWLDNEVCELIKHL